MQLLAADLHLSFFSLLNCHQGRQNPHGYSLRSSISTFLGTSTTVYLTTLDPGHSYRSRPPTRHRKIQHCTSPITPQKEAETLHSCQNGLVRRTFQQVIVLLCAPTPGVVTLSQQIGGLLEQPRETLGAVFLRTRRSLESIRILVFLILFISTSSTPGRIRAAPGPLDQEAVPRHLSLGPPPSHEGVPTRHSASVDERGPAETAWNDRDSTAARNDECSWG